MWGRTHNSRVACGGRLNIVQRPALRFYAPHCLRTRREPNRKRNSAGVKFGRARMQVTTSGCSILASPSRRGARTSIRTASAFGAASGYGRYEYEDLRMEVLPCGDQVKLPKRVPCRTVRQRFKADISYSDALIGYHQRFGELTAKAFIGLAVVNHAIHPGDHDNKASGLEYGVKGAIELWLNVGPNAWTSVDLSYTTAHGPEPPAGVLD